MSIAESGGEQDQYQDQAQDTTDGCYESSPPEHQTQCENGHHHHHEDDHQLHDHDLHNHQDGIQHQDQEHDRVSQTKHQLQTCESEETDVGQDRSSVDRSSQDRSSQEYVSDSTNDPSDSCELVNDQSDSCDLRSESINDRSESYEFSRNESYDLERSESCDLESDRTDLREDRAHLRYNCQHDPETENDAVIEDDGVELEQDPDQIMIDADYTGLMDSVTSSAGGQPDFLTLQNQQFISPSGDFLSSHSNILSNTDALLPEDKLLEEMLNLRLNNGIETDLSLPVFPPLAAATTSPSIYPHLYNLPPSLSSTLAPLNSLPLTPMSSTTTTTLSLAGSMATVITTVSNTPTCISCTVDSTPVQYTGAQQYNVQYSSSGAKYTADSTSAQFNPGASNVPPPVPSSGLSNGTAVQTQGNLNVGEGEPLKSSTQCIQKSEAGAQQSVPGDVEKVGAAVQTTGEGTAVQQTAGEGKSKTSSVVNASEKTTREKPVKTCNHKHNNPNAKELKKMEKKKQAPNQLNKSKSTSSFPVKDLCDMTTEEEGSSPEDSCSSSVSGTDKNCACCYCEVFGHSGPSAAPVSRNYPEMRERLRLLLNKKKRSNKAAAQTAAQQQAAAANRQQHQQGAPVPKPAQSTASAQRPPQAAAPTASRPPQQQQDAGHVQHQQQTHAAVKQGGVPAAVPKQQVPGAPKPVSQQQLQAAQQKMAAPTAVKTQQQQQMLTANRASVLKQGQVPVQPLKPAESIAKKGVDEIMDFIEGNNSIVNEKKRLKKERQKQQRLEELRAKQEEERKRKEAEEAARRKREEEERLQREAAEKAAKKMKKKAAQKAKKLAAKGLQQGGEEAQSSLDIEALHFKHIQEQKELLEKQKQELEIQQRMLDLQLKKSFPAKVTVSASTPSSISTSAPPQPPAAATSKKQAKKAAKAAAAALNTQKLQQAVTVTKQPVPGQTAAPPSAFSSPHLMNGGGGAPGTGFYPQFNSRPPQVAPMFQSYAPPQPAPPAAMPFMFPGSAASVPGGAGFPGAGGPTMMQPHFAGFSPGPATSFSPHHQQQQQQQAPVNQTPVPGSVASKPKSDQPMVTIKRVMRPDTNEPTVTISVKKDEAAPNQQAADKEKVLFTLINGQVMKTSHAPDNLIPSAVPLPRDLARQVLPEDLQEATLTKKQRRKLKKKAKQDVVSPDDDDGPLDLDQVPVHPVPPQYQQHLAQPHNFMQSRQMPSAPAATGRQQPPSAFSGSNSQLQNRVPLTPDGHVDLNRLSLPDGISISKITGPVPERKYFPSKPAPETEANSMFWPHQQPGFKHHPSPYSMGAGPPPTSAAFTAQNGVDDVNEAMYANDPNVIVVDTNKLPTREEEEKSKKKKKAKSSSPETTKSNNNVATGGGIPSGGIEYTPGQPLPPAVAGASGGGQVLIKSVNGKVVITPVPGSAPAPAAPPAAVPPPAAVMKQLPGGADLAAALSQKVNLNSGSDINQGVMMNGESNGVSETNPEEAEVRKKKKKKKKNADDLHDEINSVFVPRDGLDLSGDMDAADREIEEFKQFCWETKPLTNRTKVNLDLKNIKKKD